MKTPVPTFAFALRILGAFVILHPSSLLFAQGALVPPGAPAPTMKTLDQIEPHTAITSLPITISTPGSYYLTGNLTATADGTAITIAADNVTIDLNRFTLAGGGTGTRTGIEVTGSRKGIGVRNGTLTGWPNSAIAALNVTGGVYEDLRVTGNVTPTSISGGYGALVRRCVITANGGNQSSTGLFLNAFGSVIDCTVSSNTGRGIQTFTGCNIVNTTASGNTGPGIIAGFNNTVAHCTASSNGAAGISASSGSTVTNCTASGNDTGIAADGGNTISQCLVYGNAKSGLSIGNFCQVTGCTAATNNTSNTSGQAGLTVTGTGSRIDSNHFANNNFAGLIAQGVSGNIIIRNTFYGAQSIVDPGNVSGPGIIMSSGGTITSTNPWANIYY